MKAVFEQELAKTSRLMLDLPWENRNFYASFLAQTFHFVSHSTRLLAFAGALAKVGADQVHRHFISHIGEEKGHDKLALSDLKNLGFPTAEPILPATMNLFETQYYKVQFIDPQVLHAYILALEGVASSICPALLPRITAAHGEKCARFLKLHVEEDPGHVELGFAEVAKVEAALQQPLLDNLQQSFANYRLMLRTVADIAGARGLTKTDVTTSSGSAIQI